MSKYKIINKLGRRKLVINSPKGQQLSENEVYLINNKLKGMLPIEVEVKGSAFKLLYDITDYVTLRQFLALPLSFAV